MKKKARTITIHFGPKMTAFIIRATAMIVGVAVGVAIVHFFRMHEAALAGGYGVAKVFEAAGSAAADAIVEAELLDG